MPTVVKSNAKDILLKLIDDSGIKKNFIANKIGISASSMSALLHGRKKFTADTAIQISKILNLPDSVFLTKSYSKSVEK